MNYELPDISLWRHLREQENERIRRAIEFLGDPTVSVFMPIEKPRFRVKAGREVVR